MRVLIADDQPKVRSSLRLLLQREPDISVVAEVTNVESLLAQAKNTCPDLVLLDWGLVGLSSVDVITKLHAECPKLGVIVLSGRPDVEQLALTSGAAAFVCKVDTVEQLLEAIRLVMRVDTAFNEKGAHKLSPE